MIVEERQLRRSIQRDVVTAGPILVAPSSVGSLVEKRDAHERPGARVCANAGALPQQLLAAVRKRCSEHSRAPGRCAARPRRRGAPTPRRLLRAPFDASRSGVNDHLSRARERLRPPHCSHGTARRARTHQATGLVRVSTRKINAALTRLLTSSALPSPSFKKIVLTCFSIDRFVRNRSSAITELLFP